MDTLEQSIQHISRADVFPDSEVNEVNRAYARWRSTDSQDDKYVIDLWTYRRVFLHFQLVARKHFVLSTPDRDLLIDTALQRIAKAQKSLRNCDRYAIWVTIVCRNTFLSFRQSRKNIKNDTILDFHATCDDESELSLDRGLCQQAVLHAIGRLPEFLADVVQMRFLEDLSYSEISARIGKPVATARTYVSRGLAYLRRDPQLVSLWCGGERRKPPKGDPTGAVLRLKKLN